MQKVLISTQPIIKKYLDFVAGVSACTLGHQPARVNQAIKDQLTSIRMLWYTENILKAQLWNIASF
jgi:4-aminobutyrate aminotransferase-like enzyme